MSAAFNDTTITIGLVLALVAFVIAVLRAIAWLKKMIEEAVDPLKKETVAFGEKLDAKIEDAVQPISIKVAATELRLERLADKLTEVEINMVRNFVSNASVLHLEHRMDQGFKSMHEEVTSLRNVLLKRAEREAH